MDYLEAPAAYAGCGRTLFLAGGITGVTDWQQQARRLLAGSGAVVVNPRRAHYDLTDAAQAAEQIGWEFDQLSRAAVVLFWFAPGPSVQPITLYELGRHAAGRVPLAVGADPAYPRRLDVTLQLGHARPDLVVHDTLAATAAEARRLFAPVQ